MALTTSAFFWASCAAVLIPLLIHLLRRHKPKQILFPPLELVRQRQNTSQRRFRFRQAALLFLRAAVLLLFGLLLARPAAQTGIRKSESGPSARAAVLLFDTSLRMGYEQNGRTRLEEAKTLGLALLDAMPSETRVAVCDTQNSGAAFQIDHLAARERIEQLEPRPQRYSLTESAAEAVRLLAPEQGETELIILSDFTAAGWLGPGADSAAGIFGRCEHLPRVFLADFAPKSFQNISLTDVGVSVSGTDEEGEAEIGVTVSAAGKGSAGILKLVCGPILAGGETKPLTETFSEADFTAPNDEKREPDQTGAAGTFRKLRKTFRLRHLPVGLYQGTVTKTPPDPLTADDMVSFTFEVRPAKKLLFAAPDPKEKRALFLRTAVSLSEQVQRRSPFEIETLSYEQLFETRLDPARTAAVFLLDPPPLSAPFLTKLETFVRAGGGAGLFLGQNFSANQPAEFAALFGGTPLRQVNRPEGTPLIPDPGASALLGRFGAAADTASLPWSQALVYRYWRFDWNEESPSEVLFRCADGAPAFLLRPLGRGTVIFSTTPFSDLAGDPKPWNRITIGDHSWLFLLLADGITAALTGREGTLNKAPFEPVDAAVETVANLAVVPPDGKAIALSVPESETRFTFNGTGELGSYRVTGGQTPKILTGFSVNPRAEEVALEPVTDEELQKLFRGTSVSRINSAEKLEAVRSRLDSRADLYSLLALLLGLLLAAELLSANRIYRDVSP